MNTAGAGREGPPFVPDRPTRPGSTVEVPIISAQQGGTKKLTDQVATEEPMEIRVIAQVDGSWVTRSVSITMRTPGNDFELAAGFLFTEGVIGSDSIQSISYCNDPSEKQNYNIVNVRLDSHTKFDPERLTRHFYANSSCGVCGKASLELLRVTSPTKPLGSLRLSYDYLVSLPKKLANAQAIFSKTGGLHACALFDARGNPLLLREDVGRHNALDKLVGALLLQGKLPASETVLLVSGRASFELVQKAVVAGVPALAAVGAPSSLAVEVAREYGLTLLGFLRDGRFNVYAGQERLL